ncbi:hypothetical protein TBLA_0I01130 [Henningerozyma blattae CBS 6284]|uniref:U3 small nucleolar RNA-associated protein 11 n=1 Tax=Henningerozyma blattae (strain ATCC 34711 / CBS 6284 / DSM 70876 / NBRC 10599 / NRRL Y-10934 / UCD 77-7) TaxID=1071380 RepID=I2H8S1_HENB6|nr:hypothetical protein TBLA_0I01130 [Tetrapisispora blattae CBS 6284]CCH62773.1 hypothetical protein TBLA_0I01130 [Tetrapisispora blattae CBS 6284]
MAKLVHNTQKKQHRERSQTAARSRLGFLEKHKDYVKRAQDYHAKQNTLKILRAKAQSRNEDEFYYGMNNKTISQPRSNINTNLSTDEIKLLKSQDLNYINTMHAMHKKSIEKQVSNLALPSTNSKHTIFVDSKSQLKTFDPKAYFKTTDALLYNKSNRLQKDQLQRADIKNSNTLITPADNTSKKLKNLNVLKSKYENLEKLSNVQSILKQQKILMNSKVGSKKMVKNGVTYFKFNKQRSR